MISLVLCERAKELSAPAYREMMTDGISVETAGTNILLFVYLLIFVFNICIFFGKTKCLASAPFHISLSLEQ